MTKNKTLSAGTKALVNSVARVNFWVGLLTTCLGLGVSFTLINNWYTRFKVLQEQEALSHGQRTSPLVMNRQHAQPESAMVSPYVYKNDTRNLPAYNAS